jgi:hypothetical protein
MQITELHAPVNGGTLFWGRAVSRRGRRYDFCATPTGSACCIYREDLAKKWLKVADDLQAVINARAEPESQRRTA